MSGIMENNVVVLHNVNAFTGQYPPPPPAFKPVFGMSDPRCDEWDDKHLSVVFAIGNGAPGMGEWENAMSGLYYAGRIRSLSVSDVVVLNGRYYRCDSYGWSDLGTNPDIEVRL